MFAPLIILMIDIASAVKLLREALAQELGAARDILEANAELTVDVPIL